MQKDRPLRSFEAYKCVFSQLCLNGHLYSGTSLLSLLLYKTDTVLKQAPNVFSCLSLLFLADSL